MNGRAPGRGEVRQICDKAIIDVESGRPGMLFPEIVVAGCGNPLFADDGFGPAAVKELQDQPLPGNVKVVDAGTSATYCVFTLLDPEVTERLIILDTVDFGAEPGSIALFRPDDLPPGIYCDPFAWDIAEPLDLIKDRIDVLILGCQPKRITYPDIEVGLSRNVAVAVPRAVRIVQDIIGLRLP